MCVCVSADDFDISTRLRPKPAIARSLLNWYLVRKHWLYLHIYYHEFTKHWNKAGETCAVNNNVPRRNAAFEGGQLLSPCLFKQSSMRLYMAALLCARQSRQESVVSFPLGLQENFGWLC